MTAISEFATRQAEFNHRLGVAIAGVAADVASLNAKIEELQNSSGAISAEDQALLDDLQQKGEAVEITAIGGVTLLIGGAWKCAEE